MKISNSITNILLLFFKNNLNLSSEDIESLSIGISVLLFNIFELALILIFALIFNLEKELIMFLVAFIILRTLGAGIHCKKKSTCFILTFGFFIGSSILAKYYKLNFYILSCISCICIFLLYKYSPADTENRPIIGEKRRHKLKIITTLSASLIFILSIIIKNETLINCTTYALLVETLSVIPLTYKLLNINYENYKYYE